MRWALSLFLLAALALPAAAAADRAPTLAEVLGKPGEPGIADVWAAKVAPDETNYCAGRLTVLPFRDLGVSRVDDAGNLRSEPMKVHGLALGWVDAGAESGRAPVRFVSPPDKRPQVWDPTVCVAPILAGQDGYEDCKNIVHELLHFVVGPYHVGPLAQGAPRPPCTIDEPVRVDLFRAIEADLPQSRAPWRVSCTRNSRRMRCKASSPRASQVRRYRARIVGEEYSMGREGESGWRF